MTYISALNLDTAHHLILQCLLFDQNLSENHMTSPGLKILTTSLCRHKNMKHLMLSGQ